MRPPASPAHLVTTAAQLEALTGPVSAASVHKEVDHVHPAYRALIERSPFYVLATSGPGGLDASPRGDAPGFVVVEDEKTLLMPERRGNNRIDSLRNIVADPRVALLFLIPGVGETLRVNGRARIRIDPPLLERFAVQDARPKCVVEVAVETVYFQCARAILRSKLWGDPAPARPEGVPSTGSLLAAVSKGEVGGDAYDEGLAERQRATLY